MDTKVWKRELHRFLELFEYESTITLDNIKRNFIAAGRPFDDNFRQYFLKMLTLR